MNNKESNKSRFRSFKLLLYKDNVEHMAVLDLLNNSNYSYLYVLHDKDILETGELCKPHYHVLLKFTDAKTISALSKIIGLDSQFIRKADPNQFIEYMTHKYQPNKFQYDLKRDFSGTLKDYAINKFRLLTTTEDDRANEILDIINSYDTDVILFDFVRDITRRGLFSDFRRGYSLYKDLFRDHMARVKIGNFVPYNEGRGDDE